VGGGVAAGVGAEDGQVRLLDLDGLGVGARADPDGVAGAGGVDGALDGVERFAGAEAGPVVVRLVVDDQDAVMMMPAGGAGRDHVQADGGDNREQQHCSTSLHGPKPPG
jgi:hypothetical protein